MRVLTLNLDHHSYPIYIGSSIFTQKSLWQKLITGSQICIVTNQTIASLYLSKFSSIFSEIQCDTIILPDGEIYKNLEHWQKILDDLIAHHHRRNTTLIALGGGVVGDMTGFAASCYQRGVNFIQLPTTLLAQVDASIGGKTGINYQHQKNVIGAFYHPKAAVIDALFLSTLPEREFRAGLAEVIKYALIYDKNFFYYLCENVTNILARAPENLLYIIETSVKIKINFVEQDEYDQTGKRALLNFGHTFGHALESVSNYSYLHGEAVAWGMYRASRLSQHLGYLSQTEVSQVEKLLEQCGLLLSIPDAIQMNELIKFMMKDKKNHDANITLILLKNIGNAVVSNTVDEKLVMQILSQATAL